MTRSRDIRAVAFDLDGTLLRGATVCEVLANRLAPGALEGTALLREAGIEIFIVSITWSFAVEHFARPFGATAWQGTELREDGTIGHVWAEDKATWLESRMQERGLSAGEVAAVGDSLNDVPLLNAAELPFYVGSRPPPTLSGSTRHRPAADIRDIAREILEFRSNVP
jgi:phosphoserine phosphatase